jgi:hypothetical protein
MPARCSMLQRGSISTILSPARLRLRKLRSFGPKPRFGVPLSDDLDFFGDREAESLFAAATAKLEQVGGTRGKAAFAPFRDAGRLFTMAPGWPSACTQRKRFSMMIRMQCSR